MESQVRIREFMPGDEVHFRRLNEEWILRYFEMEPADESILSDPHKNILADGGRIFFAIQGGEVVGCCALIVTGVGEYELAKMAVAEGHRRAGIGRQLLSAAIAGARASGAKRVSLETNNKLTGAIRLYESAGFRHLPPERVTPSPYARSNVSMELYF